jgi:hypothetical protein
MAIAFEIDTRHFFKDYDRVTVDEIIVDFETGVGLAVGQGVDPQVMLRISRDGGRTWGAETGSCRSARSAKYKTRVSQRRCGTARDFVFKWRITDPVKRCLTGLAMRATPEVHSAGDGRMTINSVPERSDVLDEEDRSGISASRQPWLEFFRSIFFALFGWKRTYTANKAAFDFPNIVAGGESTTTVAVPGARQGDAVIVTSKTKVVGLGVDGFVLANDVATIRRFNYSLGAIDPVADDFRVIVFQQ